MLWKRVCSAIQGPAMELKHFRPSLTFLLKYIYHLIFTIAKFLEDVDSVPLLSLDVIVQSQDEEEGKKPPRPAHEVPDVMTIEEV